MIIAWTLLSLDPREVILPIVPSVKIAEEVLKVVDETFVKLGPFMTSG